MLNKSVQQGRSSAADPRFTAPGSDARTPLEDFFSILLELLLAERFGEPQPSQLCLQLLRDTGD